MNDQARAAVFGWHQTVNAAWDQLRAGMAAGGPVEEPPPGPRGLTASEVEIARSVFGDALDTSRITVNESAILAGDARARALWDYTINFPPGTFKKAGASPKDRLKYEHWLVHELTHMWQYQHGASGLTLLPDAVAGDYDYDDTPNEFKPPPPGKTFADFNHEEQGAILADYYLLTKTRGDVAPYEPLVNEVRNPPPPPSSLEQVLLSPLTGRIPTNP